ncbi:hypothetical protein D3C73_1303900 [compost metagenome]
MEQVSSMPLTKASSITGCSWRNASATAGYSSSGFFTLDMPMLEPPADGLTISGKPSFEAASALNSPMFSRHSQSAVGMPEARSSRFVISLSMQMALDSIPLPLYGMPSVSSTAWTVPSSPNAPCSASNAKSRPRT